MRASSDFTTSYSGGSDGAPLNSPNWSGARRVKRDLECHECHLKVAATVFGVSLKKRRATDQFRDFRGGVVRPPPLNLATVVKFDNARKRALCIFCVCYCVVLARKRAVSYCVYNVKHVRAQARDVCRVLFVCMASRLNWDFGGFS